MIASGPGTNETTRVYYIVMAYGELGTVIFKDVIRYWLGVGWPSITSLDPLGDWNMHHNNTGNEIICPIIYFFSYSHELLANGAMVLFGIERVFALYVPLHVHTIFTFKRSICILSVLLIVALLYCSTIFHFVESSSFQFAPTPHEHTVSVRSGRRLLELVSQNSSHVQLRLSRVLLAHLAAHSSLWNSFFDDIGVVCTAPTRLRETRRPTRTSHWLTWRSEARPPRLCRLRFLVYHFSTALCKYRAKRSPCASRCYWSAVFMYCSTSLLHFFELRTSCYQIYRIKQTAPDINSYRYM